jgi:MFS family permease
LSSTALTPVQRRILGLALVPLFMSLLSVSIVNVVLPSLQKDIGATSSQLQWVLTGYALAFGVLLVAAGRAGDVFGRGKLFLIGVSMFGVGSLVAGLSPDPVTLNIARVVMGFGSGFLNPQGIGLIQQYFSGAQRGKAFGIFGGVVGVSVAIGPVLGGFLIQLFGVGIGWRAAFLINVPFCILAMLLAKPWLPKSAWKPVPPGSASSTQPIPVVTEAQKSYGEKSLVQILIRSAPFFLPLQFCASCCHLLKAAEARLFGCRLLWALRCLLHGFCGSVATSKMTVRP